MEKLSFKKHIKRIIAAFLCAFIFITFLPVNIYALDELSEEEPFDVDELSEAEPGYETPSEELPDPDSLLEEYLDKRLKEELGTAPPTPSRGLRKAASAKRRNRLNDNEKIIYDALKVIIDRVAAGEESSTEVSVDIGSILSPYYVTYDEDHYMISSESLGIDSAVYIKKTEDGKTYWTFSDEAKAKLYDFSMIIDALMADEPYAFYWFDKTVGIRYGISGLMLHNSESTSNMYFLKTAKPMLNMSLVVSEDYRAGSDKYAADTEKTGATAQAVANAADIISANAGASDFDKLSAYKDRICEFTSYNDGAAYGDYPYGDPWQMIYVFDDDTTTKVVCEGYSKAFQYLCDHTDFISDDIECDSVTGILKGVSGEDGHMWNILHMDDGRNYIADVTNSDAGALGSSGGLFLSPAMQGGSVTSRYQYDVDGNGTADVTYIYDKDTLNLFSESELVMSETEYIRPHVMPDASYTWTEDGSKCTASGTCTECGESFTEDAVITADADIPATCTEEGRKTCKAEFRTRGFNHQMMSVVIPALGHDWVGPEWIWLNDHSSARAKFTCRNDNSHTESIDAEVKSVIDEAGENTIYTAKVSFEGTDYTDTVTEEIPQPGNERLYGSTRYETAIKAADKYKESTGGKFENVIVAYGKDFPDALSGGYLAKIRNAPILLVDQSVEDRIADYISKNITPGGTVYLLGGTGVVSSAFEKKVKAKGLHTERLGGRTRYDTNLEILKAAGVTDQDILVCTALDYADSLSASATGLPILLVDKSLKDEQVTYLKGLRPEKFYLIGGTGAVMPSIEAELKGLGYSNIERLAGNTRYETSTAVAEKFFPKVRTVMFAYAKNFPDGLSGGPLAMINGSPIILTDSNKTAAAREYVKTAEAIRSITLGGVSLIPDIAVNVIMGK